jgi:hypothetical protein
VSEIRRADPTSPPSPGGTIYLHLQEILQAAMVKGALLGRRRYRTLASHRRSAREPPALASGWRATGRAS